MPDGNDEPTRASPTVVEGSARRRPDAAVERLTRGVALGRYVVLDTLGAGGMGVVYAAYDPDLNRKVALKVMSPRAAGSTEGQSRMLREAQALARLAHPNVVAVYDVGSVGDRVFLAMELVEGQTLRAWLRAHARSWREIVDAFVAAGKGLVAAHSAGVIHRDFKPGNVLVGNDLRVRVMDFGLARADTDDEQEGHQLARSLARDVLNEDLTVTGSILGTPLYMPPEAYRGERTGEAGDQFSFCVALYEALYSRPPFDTKLDPKDDARWLVRDPPRGARVPSWIHALVVRGLARSPDARHPSMQALVDALGRDPSRRNRRVVAVLALAAVAAGVLAFSRIRHARAVAACEDEGETIASAWNGWRATQISAAFAATGVSYATPTWARTKPRLDAYAREWRATRQAVCKRADVDDTMSPDLARVARTCLDEQRSELAALVDVLVEPDPAIIQQVATASGQLPLITRCTDETQLRRRVEPPPGVRDRVRALTSRLAQAKIASAMRRHEQAIAAAQADVDAAQKLSWPPLVAEARYVLGYVQAKVGRHEEAKKSLEEAFFVAGTSGQDELAAEAAARLVFVIGYQLARVDEGMHWGRVAQMFVDRLGGSKEVIAGRLSNALGVLEFQARGNRTAGLVMFERGLTVLEQTLGASHLDVALAQNNVGIAYSLHGQHGKAREHLERAVATYEVVLGPEHPDLGKTLVSLGDVYQELGDYEQAMKYGTRGLAIIEAAFGAHHRDGAYALYLIGRAHRERGDDADARAALQRALVIYEKVFNPEHPLAAGVVGALGVLHRERGEYDEAFALHTRALAAFEKAYGTTHPDVATAVTNLGFTHLARGEPEKARSLFERALSIQDKPANAEHPDVASSLVGLGHLARDELALTHLTRALAIREKALGASHAAVAEALEGLALVHGRSGDHAKALAALERAHTIRQRVGAPAKLAATRIALARTRWAAGANKQGAIELAVKARAGYASLDDAHAKRSLADVDAWLAAHR